MSSKKYLHYTCYGHSIESELPLPELLPSVSDISENEPDIRINFAHVEESGLEDGTQLGPFLWVKQAEFWLQVPDVARFLIRNGQEILIDPVEGVDEDSIRVFLLGSAFGALLFQRGYLVLHGNAIRIGDSCMVCVGQSGAGKSTLAAAFMQRGYSILADDVVPVDSECRAIPGFPRIKLWQDTADQFGIDTSELRRIRPGMEKFNYPLLEQFADQPLPIRWVYILGSHQQPEFIFTPIRGMDRLGPLHNNTYRVRFLKGMELKAEHLKLVGKLAGKIRLARIIRPEHGFTPDQLVDRILADIEETP